MKNWKFWIGIVISILFLWLSCRNVSWLEVKRSFKNINYYYIFAMILIIILAHFFRAIRWHFLLSNIKKIDIKDLFSIIMIANMLLATLPARIGEFIRAYLLGKKCNISKTTSFSTIVLERTFDGLISILVFVIALWFYPENINFSNSNFLAEFSIKKAVFLFFIIFVLIMLFLIMLIFFTEKIKKIIDILFYYFPKRLKNKINIRIEAFINGISVLKNFKHIIYVIILSFIIWAIIGYSYYIGLCAMGINSPIYLSFILLGFIIIAVMIPAAPSFVGTFHFAVVLTLEKFYNISTSFALSYAWVIWTCGLIVNILPGLYYFNKLNIEFSNVTNLVSAEK